MLHAYKSERYLKLTTQNATKIGMKINDKKTKITVAKNSLVNSHINLRDGSQVYGQETLKMLGFVFGRRPNAAAHVDHIRVKFFACLWVIRHLLKAGLQKDELAEIYRIYIRPVIEYCSNVYHCLLTRDLSSDIEEMQRTALRLIYGRKTSYARALELSKTDRLDAKRQTNFEKFSRRTENNPRFANDWLQLNDKNGLNLHHVENIS